MTEFVQFRIRFIRLHKSAAVIQSAARAYLGLVHQNLVRFSMAAEVLTAAFQVQCA